MGDSALFAAALSACAALLTVIVGGLIWTQKYAIVVNSILAISLVAGQLIRLPLPGQGGGILVSDIAALAIILGAIILTVKKRSLSPSLTAVATLAGVFLCWAPLMLFISIGTLPTSQLLVGLAYWVRLATLLTLIPALCVLCQNEKSKKSLLISSVGAGAALIILGFIQYIFVPDLRFLAPAGWDPHSGRMVSTWLDPNFFGIFCVLYILLLLQVKKSYPLMWLATVIFTILALVATQSRSSWLAGGAIIFIAPYLIISLRHSFHPATVRAGAAAVGVLLLTTAAITTLFFYDRLSGLVISDATVQLRADSLRIAWSAVVEPHWLLGVGYNAFGWYAQKAGLIADFLTHSRSGIDNSFLALWATTGLVGLTLFSGMWTIIAAKLVSHWRTNGSLTPLIALIAIGVLAAHSLFINSFLYAHAFTFLTIIIALGWSQPNVENV